VRRRTTGIITGTRGRADITIAKFRITATIIKLSNNYPQNPKNNCGL
jgi:hypothetical protein